MASYHLYLTRTIPQIPFEFLPPKFNTNCPGTCAIRRYKNIAEKFKCLPRVQQRYKQTTNRRQTDGSQPNRYVRLKSVHDTSIDPYGPSRSRLELSEKWFNNVDRLSVERAALVVIPLNMFLISLLQLIRQTFRVITRPISPTKCSEQECIYFCNYIIHQRGTRPLLAMHSILEITTAQKTVLSSLAVGPWPLTHLSKQQCWLSSYEILSILTCSQNFSLRAKVTKNSLGDYLFNTGYGRRQAGLSRSSAYGELFLQCCQH